MILAFVLIGPPPFRRMAPRRMPMMTTRRTPVLATVLISLAACQGSPDESPRPWTRKPGEAECRWARGLITIDGVAHEGDWERAEVVSNFSMPWLGAQDRAAKAATRARLLWNGEYLYFFAEFEDRDLFASHKEHDAHLWDGDTFEIFLKPSAEKTGYYEFHVNPAGATIDAFFPQRGEDFDRRKSADPFDYEAAVVLGGTLENRADKDKGWTAEGRIAWKGFDLTGGKPAPGDLWTFALCRYDYTEGEKEPELSTCVPHKKKNFHAWEDYRPLRFVGPPKP
jgi:hypothetical protein